MYEIKADGKPIYVKGNEILQALVPTLTQEDSAAGALTFTLLKDHPHIDEIIRMKTEIIVYKDGKDVWAGRVLEVKKHFNGAKDFYVEGELAYLNDTTQPQDVYRDMNVDAFLKKLIANHNQKSNHKFEVGIVQIHDSIFRYTNRENTLDAIRDKLVNRLGGHIRVRRENGIRKIDYLKDGLEENSRQTISFGENLMDFTEDITAADLCTVVIPLGARIDDQPAEGKAGKDSTTPAALDKRVQINSVNDGKDYIAAAEAVARFGWIEKTVKFENVHTPKALKQRGQDYLSKNQFEDMTLTVKAVDLKELGMATDDLKMLSRIHVMSAQHGLDKWMLLCKKQVQLDAPAKTVYTLGAKQKRSFTAGSKAAMDDMQAQIEDMSDPSAAVENAIRNASEIIKNSMNGYAVHTENEFLIMDSPNKEDAQHVWRWNSGGLGFSSTGYDGTYETAMTMDGTIVGSWIAAHCIDTEKLTARFKKDLDLDNQIDNLFTVNREGILASAQKKAVDVVDGELVNYQSKAEARVMENRITGEVNKKVNGEEFSSYKEQTAEAIESKVSNEKFQSQIKQTAEALEVKFDKEDFKTKLRASAEDIRYGLNDGSEFIEIKPDEINFFNKNLETEHERTKINEHGFSFYRDGNNVGRIQTNSKDDKSRGLVFDLEPDGEYMGWAARRSEEEDSYALKFFYSNKGDEKKRILENTIHSDVDVNMAGNDISNVQNVKGGSVQACNLIGEAMKIKDARIDNVMSVKNLTIDENVKMNGPVEVDGLLNVSTGINTPVIGTKEIITDSINCTEDATGIDLNDIPILNAGGLTLSGDVDGQGSIIANVNLQDVQYCGKDLGELLKNGGGAGGSGGGGSNIINNAILNEPIISSPELLEPRIKGTIKWEKGKIDGETGLITMYVWNPAKPKRKKAFGRTVDIPIGGKVLHFHNGLLVDYFDDDNKKVD